ncbi:uncharacterized protein LOC126964690 [Leptidea sinapis]|uniref:uncharacterized protein LOC126964690 n=1 Tax=Leptidea sinapis TaxID=189913 RepID=UPI0021C37E91|nr:uncharacterized protein LOC126964690 [Leptidea sinapis]
MVWLKVIIFNVMLLLASHATYKYYCRRKKVVKKEINDVIMFSHHNNELRKSKNGKYLTSVSVINLLNYVKASRQSLDICMYIITNTDVTNTIIKQHLRGVKVRIIIDADMAFSTGSTIRKLEKHGIDVRWMKSTNLMHHKFCLIDSLQNNQVTPFVIIGSLNWTNQALHGNWENVTVTSQSEIVEKYKIEFERLWVEFKPIVSVR